VLLKPRVSFVYPYFERPSVFLATLRSLEYFYSNESVEIIIVDDGSRSDLIPLFPDGFSIPSKVVSILDKNGINPCLPINVGVRHSNGEIIVLSSPEVVHTDSIFKLTNGFKEFDVKDYSVFEVFAITDRLINSRMISSLTHEDFMNEFSPLKYTLDQGLGFNGYSYSNPIGSWYNHGEFKPSRLNFLSAISMDSFHRLGGFDERYRAGAGFDDYEFLRRLIRQDFKIKDVSGGPAIHLEHEEVSSRSDFRIKLNSNEKLYKNFLRRHYRQNNRWGTGFNVEVKNVN
jgi:GT2 family glycosyltransferase